MSEWNGGNSVMPFGTAPALPLGNSVLLTERDGAAPSLTVDLVR